MRDTTRESSSYMTGTVATYPINMVMILLVIVILRILVSNSTFLVVILLMILIKHPTVVHDSMQSAEHIATV